MTEKLQSRYLRSDVTGVEERIREIEKDYYTEYDAAEWILETLENLFSRTSSGRPQSKSIISPSGNGKSTLLHVFENKRPMMQTPEVT